MKYTKETSQKLNEIANYIVSQVAWKHKPVSFVDISKDCNVNNKLLISKHLLIKAICDTLLQNNRVVDVDVCYFEQEFDVILKPISQRA